MKGHDTILHIEADFFGADEAITNYQNSPKEWVATLIISGKNSKEVHVRSREVIFAIRDRFNIKKILDRDPFEMQDLK